ncbi:MAG: CBS domain-containing protein [Dysgonamonadaceae bacterium]|jgi:predicted transcriptional regulator|nr:CBS domain-containing protein [Dysgonamonadaceae bacterium]
MFCKEILVKEIPVLRPGDSGFHAAALMEDLKLKHLPVVKDGIYIYLLSEKDIAGMKNPEAGIENTCFYAPCVWEESSVVEALQVVSKDLLTLLPVVTENGEYAGAVTLPVLVESLNEMSNAGSEGALVAVELNQPDYVLSQIIHLIEANRAKVLSLFSYMEKETGKQILLFKIDLEDASPVIRSLERFNYPVKYYRQKQMLPDEILQKRVNELIHYIEL